MPAATRVTDADVPHCTGMERNQGSPDVYVNGLKWSREGDHNTSHLKPPNIPPCMPHTAPITTGSTTVFVNSKGAGRVGDLITGCTSVSQGSSNVFAGG
jgi:uncharacterized Zn-binding protein involved in type VI secretion